MLLHDYLKDALRLLDEAAKANGYPRVEWQIMVRPGLRFCCLGQQTESDTPATIFFGSGSELAIAITRAQADIIERRQQSVSQSS